MRSDEEEESVGSLLGRESVRALQDASLHLRAEAGRTRMCVHLTRQSSYSVGRQGVQPVLDAVTACEVAARLCAGDDIVRAQGVTGIWEGNGEHDRTAILEGSNDAAEGRYDGPVERSWKVFLCIWMG